MVVLALGTMVLRPYAESRWEALPARSGDLCDRNVRLSAAGSGRATAHCDLAARTATGEGHADHGLAGLVCTFYYVAHVEGKRPDIRIFEAAPYGSGGQVADTLIEELKTALRDGRPVLTDRLYGNLRRHFRVQPAMGGTWYRLSLLDADQG